MRRKRRRTLSPPRRARGAVEGAGRGKCQRQPRQSAPEKFHPGPLLAWPKSRPQLAKGCGKKDAVALNKGDKGDKRASTVPGKGKGKYNDEKEINRVGSEAAQGKKGGGGGEPQDFDPRSLLPMLAFALEDNSFEQDSEITSAILAVQQAILGANR